MLELFVRFDFAKEFKYEIFEYCPWFNIDILFSSSKTMNINNSFTGNNTILKKSCLYACILSIL